MTECPICTEIYNTNTFRVLVLPCGHSLCSSCSKETDRCPFCTIKYNSDEIPVNRLAEDLIAQMKIVHIAADVVDIVGGLADYHIKRDQESLEEKYSRDMNQDMKEVDSLDEELCIICTEAIAESYCSSCDAIMCSTCNNLVHRVPAAKSHVRVSIKERHKATRNHCTIHTSRELSFYCMEDQQAICSDCWHHGMNGPHRDHEVITLDQAVEIIVSDLKSRTLKIENALVVNTNGLESFQEHLMESTESIFSSLKDYIKSVGCIKSETRLRLRAAATFISHMKAFCIDDMRDINKILDLQSQIRELEVKTYEEFRVPPGIWDEFTLTRDEFVSSVKNQIMKEKFPVVRLRNNQLIVKTMNRSFVDSKIIDHDQADQLLLWYGEVKSEWKLLYRASRDGYSSRKFHSLCDDKSETIVIVKAMGYIFGGYTPIAWNSEKGQCGSEGKSWIFSLTNPSGIPVCCRGIDTQREIFGDVNRGPTFTWGFCLWSDCNANTKSSDNLRGDCYDISRIPDLRRHEFFVGQKNFSVTDYEVYERFRQSY